VGAGGTLHLPAHIVANTAERDLGLLWKGETAAKRVSAFIALVFASTGVSEGCRTATQVELVVTYDGNCSDLTAVGIIVGTEPGLVEQRVDTNVFTTSTSHCEPGTPARVGTLVVTPNDANAFVGNAPAQSLTVCQ
jgi:hypothetical protein